jgi:hypothetical protein
VKGEVMSNMFYTPNARQSIPAEHDPIPEYVWEVTYQLPNGDWQWYRTDLMCFEDACRQALERISSERKLIRIERVPTTVVS